VLPPCLSRFVCLVEHTSLSLNPSSNHFSSDLCLKETWVESSLDTSPSQGTPTLPYMKTFVSSFSPSILHAQFKLWWKCVHLRCILEVLHPPPPQFVFVLYKIHKIYNLQVFSQTLAFARNKSVGNPKFCTNRKPKIIPRWKPQVSTNQI
jgi:hypothetical protein